MYFFVEHEGVKDRRPLPRSRGEWENFEELNRGVSQPSTYDDGGPALPPPATPTPKSTLATAPMEKEGDRPPDPPADKILSGREVHRTPTTQLQTTTTPVNHTPPSTVSWADELRQDLLADASELPSDSNLGEFVEAIADTIVSEKAQLQQVDAPSPSITTPTQSSSFSNILKALEAQDRLFDIAARRSEERSEECLRDMQRYSEECSWDIQANSHAISHLCETITHLHSDMSKDVPHIHMQAEVEAPTTTIYAQAPVSVVEHEDVSVVAHVSVVEREESPTSDEYDFNVLSCDFHVLAPCMDSTLSDNSSIMPSPNHRSQTTAAGTIQRWYRQYRQTDMVDKSSVFDSLSFSYTDTTLSSFDTQVKCQTQPPSSTRVKSHVEASGAPNQPIEATQQLSASNSSAFSSFKQSSLKRRRQHRRRRRRNRRHHHQSQSAKSSAFRNLNQKTCMCPSCYHLRRCQLPMQDGRSSKAVRARFFDSPPRASIMGGLSQLLEYPVLIGYTVD